MDWRIEELSGGALAWLYLRPHRVTWADLVERVTAAGYEVAEERQSLVDEQRLSRLSWNLRWRSPA